MTDPKTPPVPQMKKWLVLDKKTDRIVSQHDDSKEAYEKADATNTVVQLSERYLHERARPATKTAE